MNLTATIFAVKTVFFADGSGQARADGEPEESERGDPAGDDEVVEADRDEPRPQPGGLQVGSAHPTQ